MTKMILHPAATAFIAVIEFQDAKTNKGFEWTTLEVEGTDLNSALTAARHKAMRLATLDQDTKLLSRLAEAHVVMVRIGQQWDSNGQAL